MHPTLVDLENEFAYPGSPVLENSSSGHVTACPLSQNFTCDCPGTAPTFLDLFPILFYHSINGTVLPAATGQRS